MEYNKENETIAVIVPIYNVEKYLSKCIESIINQTYKNLEIILVDDGSPDDCGKICDEYAEKDNRIKVIHKENGGVSSARNIGLKYAQGKYVSFIDADDSIECTMYEKLVEQFKLYDVDVAVCGVIDIDENEQVLGQTNIVENTVLDRNSFFKEILDEKNINAVLWNKIFKKEILNNTYFDERIKIAEDLEFFTKIINRIDKVAIIKERLYNFLIRENSATRAEFNDDWKKEIEICENIIYLAKEDYKELYDIAIKRYMRINITCYKKILTTKLNKDNKKYIRFNIKKYLNKAIMNKSMKLKQKIIILLICFKIL